MAPCTCWLVEAWAWISTWAALKPRMEGRVEAPPLLLPGSKLPPARKMQSSGLGGGSPDSPALLSCETHCKSRPVHGHGACT